MEAFINEYGALLIKATWETIYMTVVSTFFSYLLGVPLGVALSVTKKGGIASSPTFNYIAGWVVNILRSVPFVILMVFIVPFTRLIAGTSIGPNAANIPLIIAATPFVARIVEQSIEEVDRGLIEAAKCMGASNFQIITKVMLIESINQRPFNKFYYHFKLYCSYWYNWCRWSGKYCYCLWLPKIYRVNAIQHSYSAYYTCCAYPVVM